MTELGLLPSFQCNFLKEISLLLENECVFGQIDGLIHVSMRVAVIIHLNSINTSNFHVYLMLGGCKLGWLLDEQIFLSVPGIFT